MPFEKYMYSLHVFSQKKCKDYSFLLGVQVACFKQMCWTTEISGKVVSHEFPGVQPVQKAQLYNDLIYQ